MIGLLAHPAPIHLPSPKNIKATWQVLQAPLLNVQLEHAVQVLCAQQRSLGGWRVAAQPRGSLPQAAVCRGQHFWLKVLSPRAVLPVDQVTRVKGRFGSGHLLRMMLEGVLIQPHGPAGARGMLLGI